MTVQQFVLDLLPWIISMMELVVIILMLLILRGVTRR